MNTRTAPSPLACTAIAAVLAAVSTPAFAQETAPADPAPVAAAPEAPAPVAAMPESAEPVTAPAPEMRSNPVVQPVPETSAAPAEETAAPAAAMTTAARTATVRASHSASPAAVAAPVAATNSTPATQIQSPTDALAATGAAVGSAVAANTAPPAVAAAPSSGDNTAEIGLGVLGLLALGGAGAYAASRRRRRVIAEEPVYAEAPLRAEPPVRTAAIPNVSEPAPATWAPSGTGITAAPVMAFGAQPAASPAPREVEPRREAAPGAGHSAAMIPAGPLPTGAALTALFDRMVQAAPDEDNPYTSAKRRRQRVRWLMKQHEYRLRDKSTEKFDFRTYTPSSKLAHDEGIGEEVVPA